MCYGGDRHLTNFLNPYPIVKGYQLEASANLHLFAHTYNLP